MTGARGERDALRRRLAEAFQGKPGPLTVAVLRSVMQSVPSYVAAIHPDGEFLYMHRFAEGYGPEDLHDASVYDFLDAPSVEVARRTIAGVIETRQPASFHCVAPRRVPDEPPAHYEIQVAPVEQEGEVVALSLVSTDVTERDRAERALQASEATLALAVEATGMGIWWWDSRTNEVVWDDRMCSHFGLVPGEGPTTYEGFLELVHPDDRAEVSSSIQRAMETGTYEDLLHRTVVDGEIRWVLIRGHVIVDEEGRSVGLRGGVFDVTERRRIDLKMRERQKIEAVGELAAGVVHNFNNMLMAVIGSLETIEPQVDAPLRANVRAALTASHAAADIVKDLSTLTRPEDGGARRRVSLRRLVDDVSSIVLGTFPSRVRFEVGLHLDIQDDPYLEVAGKDLEHAILNLCINARDAVLAAETRDPAVELTVRRRPPREGDWRQWVEIAVRDNGTGMDEATRARIFEPFFTTKEVDGTGIGLFTTLRTVNEHGGLLDVRSEPGQGSTFSIMLPAVPATP